jgi:hypothetical protein
MYKGCRQAGVWITPTGIVDQVMKRAVLMKEAPLLLDRLDGFLSLKAGTRQDNCVAI